MSKFNRIMVGIFSFVILALVGAVVGFFIHLFDGDFARMSGQEIMYALSPYILVFGGLGAALSYFLPNFMMFIIDLLFGGRFNG